MNGQLPSPASSFPDAALERDGPRYPVELSELGDEAPPLLHARGSLDTLAVRPRVAIVGTRRATAYGLRVTREITRAMVRGGACIVSGLASGIDGMAHRTALDEGGATIAVLGTGLECVYPKAHRDLQLRIAASGLLLTELAASDHGMPFTFRHRNRIIAALATVTIVVEAPEGSGALITTERAMEMNRTVGAVPGPIDQPQSAGANRAILDGATIIPSVEDALMLAGLTAPPRTPRGDPTGDEGQVWAALANGAMNIDALCHWTGLPAARCLAAVTRLELAGSIECALTGDIRRR